MSTKPILNFVIDPELLGRVDDFWHTHQFKSRAAAVKWLIQWALDQVPLPK